MGTGEELRALAESIIDSYEMRVTTVQSLMAQANQLLRTFRTELEDMIAKVRANLAKSENLRRKDFDRMIEITLKRHHLNEKAAEESLGHFQNEEQEMIQRLRNIVKGSKTIEDIEAIREDILNRQKSREGNIISILKRYQIEQEELKVGLKKLLEKGEKIKLKDFKIMLKAIKAQQNEHNKDLLSFLDDFDLVRNKIQNQWQTVSIINN
jgi:hypothetical protein